MSRILIMCLVATGFLTGGPSWAAMQAQGANPLINRVQAIIKTRLNGAAAKPLACQGEMICGIRMLPLAYGNSNHLPLWIDDPLRPEPTKAQPAT